MKSIGRLIAVMCCSFIVGSAALGQGVFTAYSQNFDGSSSLPTGWTADPGAGTWSITTTSSSTGYPGASDANNVVVTNNGYFATLSLTVNASISTVGYTNLTVIWGGQRTSTFTETVTFAWSTDGSTWNAAHYIEVAANSTWTFVNSGTPISLPAGAEGAINLQFKWTITQLNNSGNYRIDDFVLKGTRALRDGDGIASLTNSIGSGVLNNTLIFQKNAASQSVQFTITGSVAGTLTKVSVAIPYQWGWSGNGGDVSRAGDGASLTNQVVSGAGINGNPYVITYDGGITDVAIAKIKISNLTTADVTSLTDNGNYPFVVSTAIASGTLTPIGSSPKAYVIIPIANIRNQSGSVPVLNNNLIATEGVATVASGVFSAIDLQSYIQDATAAVNLIYSNAPPTITEGNDYIVKGAITQFQGNTLVGIASTSDIINNGVSTVPAFQVVTAAALIASPESYEGKYVAVQNVSRSTGTWPTSVGAAGSGVTLVFSDGANNLNVFVDYDTNIDGNPEPVWPMDLKGIFYQSAATPAYTLAPRSFAGDIAPAGTLPVELTSLAATANRLNAQLKWSTATETNNFGFEIERKSENSRWSKVGFVAGAGTSTAMHTYSFSDNVDQAGLYEYRIKQIDKNGTFKYSPSTQVVVGTAAKVLSLDFNYPNPFNPATNIEFTAPTDGRVVLKVYNVIGQEVATLFDGEAIAGRLMKASFDASRLPTGVYFSRMEFGGTALVKRMMLVK